MTKNIEAYIQQQKQDLADFKRLAKENPDEARRQAEIRLVAAGIIDEMGQIAKPYR